MSFRLARRLACSAAFLAVALPAFAQVASTTCNRSPNHPPPTVQMINARRMERQACAADAAALCPGVPATCGMLQRCLASHTAQLSSTCSGARQNLRAIMRAPA